MKRWLLILVLVFLVGSLMYFFYPIDGKWQYQNQPATTEELNGLVQKVGRLTILPTTEAPTVVTVADPAKLKQWPLFRDAKAGDKVLVYQKSGKIILYDPVTDKIVAAGIIN